MRKTAKILCTALPVISAAGAAAGLYKLAGYFFNYCLVRTNPGYKAAQNKAHENLSPKQAAEDFFQEEHLKWFDSQHPQTVHIVSEDSLKLSAYYIPAPKPTKNFLLAIHGYRCNGREEYAIFSPFYHHDMNFNLLIPDDRAHGRSEGKYIGFGCLDRKDCLAWCRYITKTFGNDCRIFLHGVSMGASTVLAASGDPALLPQIKGIIADCGFSRGWDELKYILKKTYHLPSFPLLNLFDRICRAKAGYSTKEYSPIEQVVHSRVPILFIHGDEDDFVPTPMAYALYDACASQDKELWIVHGAAHARSYYTDQKGYELRVHRFICKHMSSITA